jgi:hypothetical protein
MARRTSSYDINLLFQPGDELTYLMSPQEEFKGPFSLKVVSGGSIQVREVKLGNELVRNPIQKATVALLAAVLPTVSRTTVLRPDHSISLRLYNGTSQAVRLQATLCQVVRDYSRE